jgi:hypothetical protein
MMEEEGRIADEEEAEKGAGGGLSKDHSLWTTILGESFCRK